ncbi:MAG: GAF domain-containing protein [Actinobacteria bacterium]|nr:GAF domain-containing protein [Actinomycetota bacterium]
MTRDRIRDLEQARRLEHGLVAVRWFAVVFAAFQAYQAFNLDTEPLRLTQPLGFGLVAALALGNAAIAVRSRRATEPEQLRTIGVLAFTLDIAVTTGLIWNYSYIPNSSVWVAAYILALEGAVRYQLVGAVAATAVLVLSESARELYVARVIPSYEYEVAAVTFRVGIGTIIGLVAGFMARSLDQVAEKARDRALLAEEAALRATVARRELAAFHKAVLAGVAASDLEGGVASMAEAIASDLELQCLSILLVDDGELVARARHGTPPQGWVDRIPFGTGVAGRVAETREPLLAPVEGGGSAAAAALVVSGKVIGVVEASSTRDGEVDRDTLELLVRLADQIALVVHSAELRARQEETLERLRELDEMKSDFVAITSHELRTPLTAVRGFVRTLIRNFERLSEKQVQDFLAMIDRQSDRLTRLVEDLLVVSRIEAGTISVTPEPIEVGTFLKDVVKSLGQTRHRIQLELAGDLPDRVLLDPHRVDQILSNLLHNALKFSPRGAKVRLAAGRRGDRLALVVTDRGIGIPPEELPQVFDRFHQAAPALTREAEGAGLGLYITRRLVDAMGGDIEVESEVGAGSTFTVLLPLAAVGDAGGGPGRGATGTEGPRAEGLEPASGRRAASLKPIATE